MEDADSVAMYQTEIGASNKAAKSSEKPISSDDDAEASTLKALSADVRDQDDLERNIGRQVRLSFLKYDRCIIAYPRRSGRPSTQRASRPTRPEAPGENAIR